MPSEPYACILISTNATNQHPVEAIILSWKKNKPPVIHVYIVSNEGWQQKILNEWRYTKPFDFEFRSSLISLQMVKMIIPSMSTLSN